MAIISEVLLLFAIDALFVGVLVLCLTPLFKFKRAAFAVMKRNFIGYFSNPTGYVFLCLFVLLTSLAAFWPHEFFNANLANLDQLTRYLPLIMLIFIPAVTMGIWAEERRQGTDELLLTLPANDFDIVIGKYLAAASIFTVSLIFSQLSNYSVLVSLTNGDLDAGLIFSTYLGYWLTGLAMLAIGMVASFLTGNLTVGFILGVVFNAPLVFAVYADAIVPQAGWARTFSDWSIASQIDDFARGVLSLSSGVYFVMLIVVGLYLSMVLIGKRHWSGGRDGESMLGHYLLRAVSLVVIALFATLFFSNHDWVRVDATEGKVSSLSPDTKRLIRSLEPEHPIYIDAFISEDVPESYVKTKFELISMLKEFQSMAGSDVIVHLHDGLETFSEQAALAEERFGITPQTVRTRDRGAFKEKEIILGAAFSCGLEKVVVPFFDYGIPVEYELVRSIVTVSEGTRQKLGIVRTDAQLMGGFSFAGGMPQQIPRNELISELEKQFDVEEVDPTSPIPTDTYAAILVAQPSSLGPAELNNVVEAIKAGQPTAIFEDPFPWFMQNVPATGAEKQSPGGMFGGGQPSPKGDIRELWKAIGIEVPGKRADFNPSLYEPSLVWQDYLPYRKLQLQGIPKTWIFAREEAPGGEDSISPEHQITSGLDEILLPIPGLIKPAPNSDLKFTPLVTTGTAAGTIGYEQFRENQRDPARLRFLEGEPDGKPLVLAAQITGSTASDSDEKEASDADATESEEDGSGTDDKAKDADDSNADKANSKQLNVIYVADIDLMIDAFLRIRARPDEEDEIQWQFENVTFLLNIVDELAGDDKYIPIRKRKPRHSTLRTVEAAINEARENESAQSFEFQRNFDEEIKKAQAENDKIIEKFQKRREDLEKKQRSGGNVSLTELQQAIQELAEQNALLQRKLEIKREQLERDRDVEIQRIRREADLDIQKTQNMYKLWAVIVPPIPPFLVGLVVFVVRRLREREGISKARLR